MIHKILLAGLFVGLLAIAGPEGPELVKAQLPALYHALVAKVGPDTAHKYLKSWTQEEVDFFREKAAGLLRATSADKTKVPSTDQLYAKYASDVFGTMGETFANVRARERLAPPAIFLDERIYNDLNPDGNKPDGLSYKVVDGQLILLSVVESKAGLNGCDRGQMNGVLTRWRTKGIRLPVDGKPVYFPPGKISIRLPTDTGFEEKPLKQASNEECEAAVLLIASRRHGAFRGEVVYLPMDASTIREVVYEYVSGIRGTRTVEPLRENFRVPLLDDPEKTREFREELTDWVVEKRTFPKAGGPSSLEKYLAHQISARGGQSKVFINDLDDTTRDLLAAVAFDGRIGGDRSFRSLPAMNPFERTFLTASPSDPNVRSALRAYYHGYLFPGDWTEQTAEQIEALPFFRQLQRIPAWAEYFKTNSLETVLRGEEKTPTNCAGWFARFRRWVGRRFQ